MNIIHSQKNRKWLKWIWKSMSTKNNDFKNDTRILGYLFEGSPSQCTAIYPQPVGQAKEHFDTGTVCRISTVSAG